MVAIASSYDYFCNCSAEEQNRCLEKQPLARAKPAEKRQLLVNRAATAAAGLGGAVDLVHHTPGKAAL